MRVINRRAKFDYQILEIFEAGISLSGSEAKSVREKRVNLSQSFAKIINGEVYLVNVNIPSANQALSSTRSRKLLLHKKEIISLNSKIKQRKLTLVPLAMYTKGRLVKVELALAKPRRKFEKKAQIKKKDIKREIERELKGTQ